LFIISHDKVAGEQGAGHTGAPIVSGTGMHIATGLTEQIVEQLTHVEPDKAYSPLISAAVSAVSNQRNSYMTPWKSIEPTRLEAPMRKVLSGESRKGVELGIGPGDAPLRETERLVSETVVASRYHVSTVSSGKLKL
jgi:hypothetical protein